MNFDPEIIKKFDFQVEDGVNVKLLKAKHFLELKQALGEHWYFEALDESNTEFKLLEFGFSASNIQISNDSSNMLFFGWSLDKIDGFLYPQETLPFNQLERSRIYIINNGKIRIWAY